jgi:hypothetical protein
VTLRPRQLIPPLTIHTADGRNVRAWDFKQKRSLVIVFLDVNCGPCEEFLRHLAQRAADLAAKDAIALVVFLEPPVRGFGERMPAGVIIGSDMSGRSARAFLGEGAISTGSRGGRGVFVADRYGELSAQWIAAQHEFPAIEDIFTTFRGIETACEECCTPYWPVDN